MSTAGKVLSVIVMLMAFLWVILAAGVAQLNRNYAKLLQNDQKSLVEISANLEKAQADLAKVQVGITLQQHDTENALTVREIEIADLEKARAQMLEVSTRVKIQADGMDVTNKAAVADQEQRKTDLAAATVEKAKSEADVRALAAENEKLKGELETLQKQFSLTLEENRKKAGLPALNLP